MRLLERGIDVVKVYNKFTKNMLMDGLHPNSKGHQKIFEIVRDYLKKEKLI